LRLLDVGSGGGLPGIPLAIAQQHWHVTLIDTVRKKTAFLQHVKAELHLANVEVVHARVESWRGAPFDCIVSRAFSSLADFTALTEHLLVPTGCWAAMKGALPLDELRALPATVVHEATVKLRVPLLDAERHLIFLRRASGVPA
jgi:16S rRNA (guanine527-N7)-methyltransferase